jgi:serine/threonine protein kinase
VIGKKLGPYEFLAKLGEGGMGEVYRARDTRLQREVAVKILPDGFANDSSRRARFEREARVLASLNHPNIATIHGVEDADSRLGLVMELVGGETLAERVARGPVPLAEALSIARQIADALDAAHESGVVHRDLKPANIKLTSAGLVKVLDFGLAKAIGGRCRQPGYIGRRHDDGGGHAGRRHRRHACVHEPRADARAAAGQAHRRLGVRLCALRDAHGSRTVCPPNLFRHRRRDSRRAT